MLPLFPLKLIVYPTENLNLHIFEPRYKDLVRDCQEKDASFGIPSYMDEHALEYGTEVQINSIERVYKDGRMDIKTRGLRIFKILDFYGKLPGYTYPGGEIEFIETDFSADESLKAEVLQLTADLYRIMKINKPLPDQLEDFHSYKIAHHVGLSTDQEYALLKIHQENKRLEYLHLHLTELIPIATEMETLRKKIQMNGHFKNIIPPKV